MSKAASLGFGRKFTRINRRPFEDLIWKKQKIDVATTTLGTQRIEQEEAEFPESWSTDAATIVAQNFFTTRQGEQRRETSIRNVIDRVVDTIVRQGTLEGYFEPDTEAEVFCDELKYALVTQRAMFNPTAMQNLGVSERVQTACEQYILGVEDSQESILEWYAVEAAINGRRHGLGVDISLIRSTLEISESGAANSPGLVSILRGADAVSESLGGAIGTSHTNRAVVAVDHPDIEAFIHYKSTKRSHAENVESSSGDVVKNFALSKQQLTCTTVGISDAFMQAATDEADWQLVGRRTGVVIKTVKARDLLSQIAKASLSSGNPSVQFDTTTNKWQTVPHAGKIMAASGSGEFMHINDSASVTAGINLLKYLKSDYTIDVESLDHTVGLLITALDILAGYTDYPSAKIAKNARAYRPVGLEFTNLGALLMAMGLQYGSSEAHSIAASLAALITGRAYSTSAKLARLMGPFAGYFNDHEAMMEVIRAHWDRVKQVDVGLVPEDLLSAAAHAWDEALESGNQHGFRNAQVTLLGTLNISDLAMGSFTGGVEPLQTIFVRHSSRSGDQEYDIVPSVPLGLSALGYSEGQLQRILQYIKANHTIIGAPQLKRHHEKVFACDDSERAYTPEDCIDMMSAVQPFISGTISHAVQLPNDTLVGDVERLYLRAWQLGLKSLAVIQPTDGHSKASASHTEDTKEQLNTISERMSYHLPRVENKMVIKATMKRVLPRRRKSWTYKFTVGLVEGYFTVCEYEDGSPGELFITLTKQNPTLAGLLDAFAIAVSCGLQYGVPLQSYVRSFMETKYAPSGSTDDGEILVATSITDYIFRRLAIDYLSFDDRKELGLVQENNSPEGQTTLLNDLLS